MLESENIISYTSKNVSERSSTLPRIFWVLRKKNGKVQCRSLWRITNFFSSFLYSHYCELKQIRGGKNTTYLTYRQIFNELQYVFFIRWYVSLSVRFIHVTAYLGQHSVRCDASTCCQQCFLQEEKSIQYQSWLNLNGHSLLIFKDFKGIFKVEELLEVNILAGSNHPNQRKVQTRAGFTNKKIF